MKIYKHKIFTTTLLVLFIIASIFVINACMPQNQDTNIDNDNKTKAADYKITFKVDDKEYSIVQLANGKIKLPANPEKKGFDFKGWYYDSEFKNVFDEKDFKFTKDSTLYAKFIEKTFTLYLNGEVSKTDVPKNDIDKYKPEKPNLTLRAWFIDEECTEPYVGQEAIYKLYGVYQAEIIFDNGHEECSRIFANQGDALKMPDAADITKDKPYMDTKGIKYALPNGDIIDNNFIVNENTTIKVIWQTPYLKYRQKYGTDIWYVDGRLNVGWGSEEAQQAAEFPAVSLPSVYIHDDKKINIESVGLLSSFPMQASTIIYQDGIKYIGYQDSTRTLYKKVNKIIFPKTLKIIENSYNEVETLKDVVLPEGVEIIMNSFRKGELRDLYSPIKLPKSVKRLINIDDRFDITGNENFEIKDNRMYQKGTDYKVLLADFTAAENNIVKIPEGITTIQALTYENVNNENILRDMYGNQIKAIEFPSTVSSIKYLENMQNYPNYIKNSSSFEALTEFSLDEAEQKFASGELYQEAKKYAVTYHLGNLQYISFNLIEKSPNIKDYFVLNNNTAFTDASNESKVYYIQEVEVNDPIKVKIATKDLRGIKDDEVFEIAGKKSGNSITLEEITTAISKNADNYSFPVITEKGTKYEYTAMNRNTYLYVEYKFVSGGYSYEADAADPNALTVTGFDSTTAYELAVNTYFVAIPEKLNDKLITSIKKAAFKGVSEIQRISIGKGIKIIDEEAFADTGQLSQVEMESGALETIKTKAFSNIGSALGADKMVVIGISLAKLKVVEPEAFASIKIARFAPAEGEENRSYYNMENPMDPDKFKLEWTGVKGEFYIEKTYYGCALYKYNGYQQTKMTSAKEKDIYLVDLQIFTLLPFPMGWQNYMIGTPATPQQAKIPMVERYEMMPGSIVNPQHAIQFFNVSKVHAGAITKVNPNFLTIIQVDEDGVMVDRYNNSSDTNETSGVGFGIVKMPANPPYGASWEEQYMKHEDFTNTDIFEEGWISFDTTDPVEFNPNYVQFYETYYYY